MLTWTRSFRVRLLAVMLLVAVLPLGIVGFWITASAARSGEDLLRARLQDGVDLVAGAAAQRWIERRSTLLDVAADPAVRAYLALEEPSAWPAARLVTARVAGPGLSAPVVHDRAGRPLRPIANAAADENVPGPGIPIVVPVHASAFGSVVGSLRAWIPLSALVADGGVAPGSVGTIIGVFEAGTGAPLVPLPFERPAGDLQAPIQWGGERWLAVRRTMTEPPLEIVGAAPLTPFERPLRDAARKGVWLLFGVAIGGLALAGALAAGMTRSLQRLAGAAEAVAAGALDRQVDEHGAREIERVARSFNRMTASLRQTLQALAEQRSLARAGEFAASLAHEVRNPLTAIRVDLQVVEESMPAGATSLRPLRRALDEIARLDRTVGAALLTTRAGRTDRAPIDLMASLSSAVETAEKSGPRPSVIPVDRHLPGPALVSGDDAALQQIFLNLLLNAIEAAGEGGGVRVEVACEAGQIVVRVLDTGPGLTPEAERQAFEPLFTTREGGTGLGLTIASRLAHAHGGTVRLANRPGGGAVATVELPGAL